MLTVRVSWVASRRPVRLVVAVVLLWLGVPTAVHAQAESGASPRIMLRGGERVRLVMRSSGELVEGELVWQNPDTLAIHRLTRNGQGSDTLVLRDDVASTERWASHHSGRSMAAGFGLGVLAGLPIGVLGVEHDEVVCNRQRNHDMCGLAVIGFPIYVLGSGLVGFTVGAFRTTHRWETVEAGRH